MDLPSFNESFSVAVYRIVVEGRQIVAHSVIGPEDEFAGLFVVLIF